LRGW
jgi:hypothetical protein